MPHDALKLPPSVQVTNPPSGLTKDQEEACQEAVWGLIEDSIDRALGVNPRKRKQYRCNAKYLAKRRKLVEQVASLKLLGRSNREISQTTGVDKDALNPLVKIAEANGHLPPQKQRIVELVTQVSEDSAAAVRRLTERVEESPDQDLCAALSAISRTMGIAVDKMQLLTGQPTGISATFSLSLGRQDWDTWLQAKVTPDCESSVPPCSPTTCDFESEIVTPNATAIPTEQPTSEPRIEGGEGGPVSSGPVGER